MENHELLSLQITLIVTIIANILYEEFPNKSWHQPTVPREQIFLVAALRLEIGAPVSIRQTIPLKEDIISILYLLTCI